MLIIHGMFLINYLIITIIKKNYLELKSEVGMAVLKSKQSENLANNSLKFGTGGSATEITHNR